MTVYIITLLSVVVLCYLAENNDVQENIAAESLAIKHTKSAKSWYIIAGGVLVFVAGLRYRVGTDYAAYYLGYKTYILDLPDSLRQFDEPGYGIIALIAKWFYDDGATAIFIASLVTIALPMIVIYKHTDKLLMAALLYVVLCWDGSFNGVRQYLAASVLFCGFKYLKDRKLIKYLIVVFIAFLFHRSALVMVAMYFVVHRKINIINIFVTILAAAVILVSYDRVFALAGWLMEKNYSTDLAYTAHNVNRLRVVSACIPSIVFLISYRDKELSDSETVYLNLSIFHAALRVFTMNSALLYRIGIYTCAFQAIAIPELLKGISGDSNRRIITAGIVVMFVGMWLYEIYISGSLNNFQWIWQR